MNLEALEEVKVLCPTTKVKHCLNGLRNFQTKVQLWRSELIVVNLTLLSYGANKNNQLVFTVDHNGSEEHQIDEEYFDNEIYDAETNSVNSFPLLLRI